MSAGTRVALRSGHLTATGAICSTCHRGGVHQSVRANDLNGAAVTRETTLLAAPGSRRLRPALGAYATLSTCPGAGRAMQTYIFRKVDSPSLSGPGVVTRMHCSGDH